MSDRDDHAEEQEFDRIMATNGIVVPLDRRRGAFATYVELKRMAQLMRAPRGAEAEPATVFNLPAILR